MEIVPTMSKRRTTKQLGWPFGFYFFQFAGLATVGPFIVLFYQNLGFSGGQIGLLAGIAPLVTILFSPLWTRLADHTGWHKTLMSVALLAGVVVLSLFPLMHTFLAVLMLSLALNVFLSPVTPLADSATMAMLGERKEMYGRIRLGGTVGYGLAASGAGVLVLHYGLRAAFWGCAVLFALSFVVSRRLVHGNRDASRSRVRGQGFRTLLANPRWLLFLAVAFTGGWTMASFNYLFPYMKELGARESMMGLALTIGTIAEIPVLYFAHRVIKRYSAHTVFMAAAVITGIRLLLFAASRSPGPVMVIQLINGLTLPILWVAAVAYANEHAPEGLRTTAQGLLSAMVYGIGAAAGGFVGGPLLESIGGRGLYLVFGIVTLAVVGTVALIEQVLSRREASSRDIAAS
ncbi:MFS transporter [Candidatus Bipolaricaulota bacterium]|nr:MFS transporter [Candidatus Bipolaricaulota bacterium]TFH11265.1 MAG: MFS transporter [Candidatus Atribacteria bacterium]